MAVWSILELERVNFVGEIRLVSTMRLFSTTKSKTPSALTPRAMCAARARSKGLAEFVIKRVEELAKDMNGSQEPQYFRGRDAEDYVLARW
jgi:hypothetical protein